MNLYRFEVSIGHKEIFVVIAAKNDEAAFELVEVELEKHFLSIPEVDQIPLYEKKKIRSGADFGLAE
ncbi:DUF3906 family protein [Bacillus taeanensis]|uniref:DUF3906 domain-containing protein n=1 Tax=Bacillus taeanensis TaxID=273032 RepID=A0A366Y3C3_9BACI|nr:DUF3906 family protein [Bacillus taeanensis]RBW70903.1 DUF3906 domain-containing protein [Bacillus taeanensis]